MTERIRLTVVSEYFLTDVYNLSGLGQLGLTDDALPLQELDLHGAVPLVAVHGPVDELQQRSEGSRRLSL